MMVEKVDGLTLLVLTGVPGPTLTESLMGGNGVSDWSGLGHTNAEASGQLHPKY